MLILSLLVLFPTTIFANAQTCPGHAFQTQCPYPPLPYTVAPSHGKGLGVFAAHDLETGSVIMREAPMITIKPPQHTPGTGYPMSEISQLVHAEYIKLSEPEKDEVLSLTYTVLPGDAARYGDKLDHLGLIFRNNAYDTGSEVGLFAKIARINHSCRPNAAYYWNEKLKKRFVYATRDIAEGEEIFVSFISLLLTREERQKKLARYGFTCTCPACSQHPVDLHYSDQSRSDINQAIRAFSSQMNLTAPTHPSAVRKALKNAESSLELANLVQKEGLADYYAQTYRIAAISHARIGDWQKATVWANEAYKRRVMEDGESPWALEMYELTRRFIENWETQLKSAGAT
ncbi:SET domain-containing protein [Bimuria novae-zelandiae CBS 107.79]|uniref:SET domain-containing protein n=1 Tax=Bimuria novae-zelandiae CBS 107.79 TaxID=1447943 RepID=A0A6A5VAM2_9PLEO|nr:SET domain-containing protein [Bimuria novae-zelandiae CBS 107.79]